MPTTKELIAHGRSYEEIAEAIGADHLVYQTVEGMNRAILGEQTEIKQLEESCFTGVYLAGNVDAEYLSWVENNQQS